jgi:hypothetical protein
VSQNPFCLEEESQPARDRSSAPELLGFRTAQATKFRCLPAVGSILLPARCLRTMSTNFC